MSRLAKKPIIIPEKTTLAVTNGIVSVKGPLGELSRMFPPIVVIDCKEKIAEVRFVGKGKKEFPMLGTTVAHIKNMIQGVNTPFSKKLIIEGVGFKADVKGKTLVLALGFSHPVEVPIPEGITVKAEKGELTLSSIDKEALGSFCARIRLLKKPEPYKGKGIRYSDEIVRRKQGKKAA